MEHHPKKTALLITRNLPPLVGGMERLVWHIADTLAQQYRLHVIGPAGCAAHLPAGVSASEIPIKPVWRFLWLDKLGLAYPYRTQEIKSMSCGQLVCA